MKDSVLILKDIRKVYKIANNEIPVLDGINLEVNIGDSIAILGPSGSGKSTLLHIMGTLDKPTSGEVIFDGESVLALKEEQLASIRNRKIGFVFQLHYLLPQCTVWENVLIPAVLSEDFSKTAERAEMLLKRLGLIDRLNHRPAQLSGGECQRVALVRALVNNPLILLADEPTGSLDRRRAEEIGDLLCKLNEEDNLTMVVVTHSIELASRMKHLYILHDGIIEKGKL